MTRPILKFLSCSFLAYALWHLGESYKFGKLVEASAAMDVAEQNAVAESLRAIQEMHKSIPFEAQIEAKNNLLLAVCKKQKTRLCKEIQDGFNKPQIVKR